LLLEITLWAALPNLGRVTLKSLNLPLWNPEIFRMPQEDLTTKEGV
jgi:hypothetical protein